MKKASPDSRHQPTRSPEEPEHKDLEALLKGGKRPLQVNQQMPFTRPPEQKFMLLQGGLDDVRKRRIQKADLTRIDAAPNRGLEGIRDS